MRHFIFAAVLMVVFGSPALASEPRLLGTHGDWAAYGFTEGGNKVCYMASQPKTAVGNYTQRGDIFALITHRPAEKTRDVFSYITGYPYKPGSEVTIDIDGRKFKLFTQDDTAWTPDAASDSALARAIQAGSKMIVKGTSKRGTLTTDTFSLKGSGKAYAMVSKECGL
ncbi:MAG: invasion associated locus B family protein [Alphaproteobacteria bacterium]|nr:invasion associated locus B family protein [Alphaproteobacteria bacterium]